MNMLGFGWQAGTLTTQVKERFRCFRVLGVLLQPLPDTEIPDMEMLRALILTRAFFCYRLYQTSVG